jgi:hypothetical protein
MAQSIATQRPKATVVRGAAVAIGEKRAIILFENLAGASAESKVLMRLL